VVKGKKGVQMRQFKWGDIQIGKCGVLNYISSSIMQLNFVRNYLIFIYKLIINKNDFFCTYSLSILADVIELSKGN